MKERYAFLMGVGVGIVLTAVIGIFLYNTVVKKVDPSQILTPYSGEVSDYDTKETTESILNLSELTTEETTISNLAIDMPNMEISTINMELDTEITTKLSIEVQGKELKTP